MTSSTPVDISTRSAIGSTDPVAPQFRLTLKSIFLLSAWYGLFAGLRCAVDEAGFLTVDATGRTSTAGVWAGGNAADPRAQVITAAGAGSAAAIAINADLVHEDVERAPEDHRAAAGAASR